MDEVYKYIKYPDTWNFWGTSSGLGYRIDFLLNESEDKICYTYCLKAYNSYLNGEKNTEINVPKDRSFASWDLKGQTKEEILNTNKYLSITIWEDNKNDLISKKIIGFVVLKMYKTDWNAAQEYAGFAIEVIESISFFKTENKYQKVNEDYLDMLFTKTIREETRLEKRY